MDKVSYKNRELSWLSFNERILNMASDDSIPLMERWNFFQIFRSNLDEFIMVRYGAMLKKKDSNLKAVMAEMQRLLSCSDQIKRQLLSALSTEDINLVSMEELVINEREFLRCLFHSDIEPFLTTVTLPSHEPRLLLRTGESYLIFSLGKGEIRAIKTDRELPRLLVAGASGYIFTTDVIDYFAGELTGMEDSVYLGSVKVLPNMEFDINLIYEDTRDYSAVLSRLLAKRRRLSAAAFLVSGSRNSLAEVLDLPEELILYTDRLQVDILTDLKSSISKKKQKKLSYPSLPEAKSLGDGKSIAKYLEKEDILLHYPFDSMLNLQSLLQEAINDKRVTKIEITLYRLSINSRIVDLLCQGAERGIEVFAAMELRARFDEENNINWSEKLQNSGVILLFGPEKYKIHAKILLITYKNTNKNSKNSKKNTKFERISYVSSGNFNETTAKLYTDFAYLTKNRIVGEEIADFFSLLRGGDFRGRAKRVAVAPLGLRERLVKEIDEEIEAQKKHGNGKITLKVNSLTDRALGEKLLLAAEAGVNVQLIVRGSCTLLPIICGVPQIRIISVVGRFLEHSRVYSFGVGEQRRMFVSSADIMDRNMEKRYELACEVRSKKACSKLEKILESYLSEEISRFEQDEDGKYRLKIGTKGIDVQMSFFKD